MCTNPDAAECAPYDTVIEAFGGTNLQLHPDFTPAADEAAPELVRELIPVSLYIVFYNSYTFSKHSGPPFGRAGMLFVTVSLKEILRIMPAENFFYFGKLVFFSGFRLDICIANRKELHYNKLTAPYLPRNQK